MTQSSNTQAKQCSLQQFLREITMNLKRGTQLKPCPFCGATPEAPKTTGGGDERNGYNFRVHIACGDCGTEVIRDSNKDKQGWCNDKGEAKAAAVAAWNRRA